MRLRLTLACLLLLGCTGSFLAESRAERDLVGARERHEDELRRDAKSVRSEIESIFRQSHVGLRSIAQFPGVRSYDPLHTVESAGILSISELMRDSSSLGTAGEIFDSLATTIGITDLYISPYPYDPQGLVDEARGIPREPIIHFTRRLPGTAVKDSGPQAGSPAGDSPGATFALVGEAPEDADLAHRELWTRQLILNQLQYIAHNLPYLTSGSGEEALAICVELKALLSKEEGNNPFTRSGEGAQSFGLIQSTPIIGEDGQLRGCVSMVIPWAALRIALPNDGFVVRHPTYGISIVPEGNTTAAQSELYWSQGKPDPNIFYSEVFPLDIPDADQKWELWTGRSGTEFWARGEVASIRGWALATHVLIWLATLGFAAHCLRIGRVRTLATAHALELQSQKGNSTSNAELSRQAAMEATAEKNAFLSRLSHEIRTPMSSILGFADVLLDSQIDNDQRVEAVQSIRRNGRHLLNMISDILDLSKIEGGKLGIERLSVRTRTIISEVVGLLEPRAKARATTLTTEIRGDVPELIQTDPMRIQQALVNLVDNAIKLTEGGSVHLVVECDRSKRRLRFLVIDDGVGMTSAQVARVFQPFQQSGDSKTVGTTGLGLTLSRRLAELLGGTVKVDSAPGKGCTFTFDVATGSLEGIPSMSETPDDPSAAEKQSWSDLPHIDGRVLLVEDGPDNQTIIAHILRRAGAEVVIASNGQEGVDRALLAQKEKRTFDAILMDIEMPILDGFAATRKLRGAGYGGQIIALTAHAMAGDEERCIAAGCDHYLAKPVDRATLVHVVAQHIGLRSDAKPAPAPPAI